ncbi:hypothetical protein I3843_12G098800 [Carya illinoinensis]|uniref:Uncharacterized protein n=1 Tax=Carya illinoinensis TaxID=32201 RepID=A0A922DIP3_CARIL|nr:hypothetical protein I3842_12G098200 [Carya illinoinensis]KAG7953227.1 hypothetical protein I3843_12G098800 [Carya illinoinensis]
MITIGIVIKSSLFMQKTCHLLNLFLKWRRNSRILVDLVIRVWSYEVTTFILFASCHNRFLSVKEAWHFGHLT